MFKFTSLEYTTISLLIIIFLFLVYKYNNNEPFVNRKQIHFYYTNWCGHSRRAMETGGLLDQLSQYNVEIVMYDCEKLKCEDIMGYPTIKLGENKIPFKGKRTVENILYALYSIN